MEVVFERDVGVAEEAVCEAIEIVAEVAGDAGDGGGFAEVEVVEGVAEAGGVDDPVEESGGGAFWGVFAPSLAEAGEFFGGHAPVGAVAVEEEVGS